MRIRAERPRFLPRALGPLPCKTARMRPAGSNADLNYIDNQRS